MGQEVRRANAEDAEWIVDLSARVQENLTVSGSLQEIGPLALQVVETSIRGGYAYVLETKGLHIGSVLVGPLDGKYLNIRTTQHFHWELDSLLGPLWYLQSLMLEPSEQGKGLGLMFLEGVARLMKAQGGTIVLNCWAGNSKLRSFYQSAGFVHHGDFPQNDYEVSVHFQRIEKPS